MIRLVGVEVRRLLSRRVVRLFGLLILTGILIAGITVFFRSQPVITDGFDRRWHLTEVQDTFLGTTVPLIILAWVIAASFVGADWHTGTMATTLTWEPRRVRLHVAKAIAILGSVFVGFFAVQAALGLALSPAAVFRGTTEGIDAAWLRETAVVLLKGATLSVVAASLGFALASVARNTAAGVGIGFAYVVIGENLLGALLPGLIKWLLVPNAVVFVLGADFDLILGRSPTEALALLAVYAVGAVAAATVAFRARDVT